MRRVHLGIMQGDPLSELLEKRRCAFLPVDEAGGGVSEGFELSEGDLIEHASHGDDSSDTIILRDHEHVIGEPSDATYGEADTESKPD